MCGLFGTLGVPWTRHVAVDPARFHARLRHRGPDDSGTVFLDEHGALVEEAVVTGRAAGALLHQRLAIRDLGATAAQPMTTADGRATLVYNGEIYNAEALRAELEADGRSFRSDGDTEVVLQALDAWGVDALPRLVGMFALAFADHACGTVLLARDPFGIKPLFIARGRGRIAFASEIKALLELPDLSRAADPQTLYDFLAWGLNDACPRTFFRDIEQLPPGHALVVPVGRPGAAPPPTAFEPLPLPTVRQCTFNAAAEAVRTAFLDSVRAHLVSDVTVGGALSGGIDSSAIAGAVRLTAGDGLAFRCITASVSDAAIDEVRWARRVADRHRLEITLASINDRDLAGDLDDLLLVQDEPFSTTSIYAQYRVFRAAREAGITVMLDGQGADELFAGYLPDRAARVATLLACGYPLRALGLLRSLAQHDHGGRYALRALHHLAPDALRSAMTPKRLDRNAWLDARWFAERGVRGAEPALRQPNRDRLRALLDNALTRTSLPGLLRFEDRNSMAFSVESRVPFLTVPFVQAVRALPEEHLLGVDGTTKRVLRAAVRDFVPEEILARRDKIGFGTPQAKWMAAMRREVGGILAADRPYLASDARTRIDRDDDPRRWRATCAARWIELLGVEIDGA